MGRLERWLYTIPLRFRSLFRREQAEHDLHDELHFHVDELTRQYVSRGLPLEEARRLTRRDTYSVEAVKERCRDTRHVEWFENTLRDLQYAWRTLRRNRVFAVTAVLTLALGIGANTTIFTIVNGVLVKPLAFPRPDEL